MDHQKDKPAFSLLLMSALRAQAVVCIVGLLTLAVFCAIAYSLADPDSVIVPLSLAALYISGIAGGVAAVRFSGDGILSGWLSGVLSALFLWGLSLLPFPAAEQTFPVLPAAVLFLCIPLSSLIGSVVGKRRRKATRQSPARMRRHSS